jgi:hypothetical protein
MRNRVRNRPQPGHFLVRLVKGGPLVPALIYLPCPWVQPEPENPYGPDPWEWCRHYERQGPPRAVIAGDQPVDPEFVWTYGREITAEEYRYRVELLAWARRTRAPEARLRRPIRLSEIAPPTWG